MNYFIGCTFMLLVSYPLCCSGMSSYNPACYVNISQEKKPKKVDSIRLREPYALGDVTMKTWKLDIIVRPQPTYSYQRLDDAPSIKMLIDHIYPYSGAPSANLDEQESKEGSKQNLNACDQSSEAKAETLCSECSAEALVLNYERARQLLKGGRHSFENIENVAELFSLPDYAIELLKKEKYPGHKINNLSLKKVKQWKTLFNLPAQVVARLYDEIKDAE